MQLGDWRYGGCKPWTTPEIARLRELVDAGMGPPANWRSEKLPGRSESTIRSQVTKPGM